MLSITITSRCPEGQSSQGDPPPSRTAEYACLLAPYCRRKGVCPFRSSTCTDNSRTPPHVPPSFWPLPRDGCYQRRDAPGRSARGHVLAAKRGPPGRKPEHEDERAGGGGGHRRNVSTFLSMESTATSVAEGSYRYPVEDGRRKTGGAGAGTGRGDDDDDAARSPFQSRGEPSREAPPPPPFDTAPRGGPRSESKVKLEELLRREREQAAVGQATGHSSGRHARSSNSSSSETRRHSSSETRRNSSSGNRRRSSGSRASRGEEGASDASSEREHRRDRGGKPRNSHSLDGRKR